MLGPRMTESHDHLAPATQAVNALVQLEATLGNTLSQLPTTGEGQGGRCACLPACLRLTRAPPPGRATERCCCCPPALCRFPALLPSQAVLTTFIAPPPPASPAHRREGPPPADDAGSAPVREPGACWGIGGRCGQGGLGGGPCPAVLACSAAARHARHPPLLRSPACLPVPPALPSTAGCSTTAWRTRWVGGWVGWVLASSSAVRFSGQAAGLLAAGGRGAAMSSHPMRLRPSQPAPTCRAAR